MTKQEEIREGIDRLLDEDRRSDSNIYPDITMRILSYLHSQGVVIKVDIGGGYSDIEPLIKKA